MQYSALSFHGSKYHISDSSNFAITPVLLPCVFTGMSALLLLFLWGKKHFRLPISMSVLFHSPSHGSFLYIILSDWVYCSISRLLSQKEISLSHCGWNSEQKTSQHPTTCSRGKLKIYSLIGVIRSFGVLFSVEIGKILVTLMLKSLQTVLKCHFLLCLAIFPPRRGNMLLLYFVLDVKKGIISNWTLFGFFKGSFQWDCTVFSWECVCCLPSFWAKNYDWKQVSVSWNMSRFMQPRKRLKTAKLRSTDASLTTTG